MFRNNTQKIKTKNLKSNLYNKTSYRISLVISKLSNSSGCMRDNYDR